MHGVLRSPGSAPASKLVDVRAGVGEAGPCARSPPRSSPSLAARPLWTRAGTAGRARDRTEHRVAGVTSTPGGACMEGMTSPSTSPELAPLAKQYAVLLTSHKKDGTGVGTPVNIAVEGD